MALSKLRSLQKGNTYPVQMERKGVDEVMFIEASPKFKSINVYDATMSSVKTTDLLIDVKKQEKEAAPDFEDSKKKDLKKGEKQSDVNGAPSQSVKPPRSRPRI